ncbi:MAG: PQQ-binding-like beta-propeller repeat protein [Brevundimonas sp.]|uniref:outer membrane protein assembly factor BamB family protein n=1 Tax=Brevundimonas sp. TaxID=1871086 RepID=UPI002736A897|nr:PQQ-binding-like beta-propeller repeat protein [Brevundimonas sp.]MDP3378983.1 PQQ-binding-like beta-propeller repeat protein [Brevundimonas sp.]
MNRFARTLLVCGAALSVAACGTVSNLLPFSLGRSPDAGAVASQGERLSVLEFDQALVPSPALAGRDFFLPGPQAAVSWPSPGGNAENAVEHVIAGADFTIAWRRNIGAGSARTRQVMSPAVAENGRIFALDAEHTVSALDAQSGSVIWRASVKPEGRESGGFGGGVALGGGKVFVSSGYRTMTAFDQTSGAMLWQTAVDVPIHGAPTVAGSRVYAIDLDNQVLAFDVNTGSVAWSYRGIVEPARIMRASSPAITGDTVIAPMSSGEVFAFRAATGQPVWQEELSRTTRTSALSEIRDIAGRPVISRGFVYAVSHSGVLASMDIRTGQPRWQVPVAAVNAPLPVGDVIYIVSKSGELSVLNRETGQVYWTRDLNVGRVRQEGGFLGFFDRTVRPTWSGPLLASNRLVLTNSDGELVGLNPKTGEVISTLRLGAPSYVAPTAFNGAILVITDRGEVISVR